MKKKSVKKLISKKHRSVSRYHERPIRWLPIHGKYIHPVFNFTSVTGASRVFLEIEITLALLIVAGTFFVVAIKLFSRMFYLQ
jgi:hypothetical protein